MKINKAPGFDGIPNIALKAAIESNTERSCIQERMFPRIWERQRLVLIPKGNNAHDASVICKILEAFLGEEGLTDS